MDQVAAVRYAIESRSSTQQVVWQLDARVDEDRARLAFGRLGLPPDCRDRAYRSELVRLLVDAGGATVKREPLDHVEIRDGELLQPLPGLDASPW